MAILTNNEAFGAAKRISARNDVDFDFKREGDDWGKFNEDLIVPGDAGDVVFLNMLLFHRSGVNISDKVRIVVQSRFHTATADDFIPFELINYYNPDIKQKLIEKNYDCSDIPNNFRQPPVEKK